MMEMYHGNVINGMIDKLKHIVDCVGRQEMLFDTELNWEADSFFSGKLALAIAIILTEEGFQDLHRRKKYLTLLHNTLQQPCESWGRYYYLLALWKLKQKSQLSTIFSVSVLNELKKKLNWNEMIAEPDYILADTFPTNFYGVAFSIARLRFLLGWEDEIHSQAILQRLIAHYSLYSSGGFADETDGNGRFDRYSILLVAEICQRHLETDMPVTDSLIEPLKHSVNLVLQLLNTEGVGFTWGRSIGAYGDSAFIEILVVALQLGLLNAEQQQAAQAFTCACSERFDSFWFDAQQRSVNLWFHGRKTDDYRGTHRIAGENITLLYQHVYVHQLWRKIVGEAKPLNTNLTEYCASLPAVQHIYFQQGTWPRSIFILRDKARLFALPLINGDKRYHASSPYFPLPFSAGLFSGVADGTLPYWIPCLYTEDGRLLMPLVFFQNPEYHYTTGGLEIAFCTEKMNCVGRQTEQGTVWLTEPEPASEYRCMTRYRFSTGKLEREDTLFLPDSGTTKLTLFGATFARSTHQMIDERCTRLNYDDGALNQLTIQGYTSCQCQHYQEDSQWRTPTGAWQEAITADVELPVQTRQKTVSWTIEY